MTFWNRLFSWSSTDSEPIGSSDISDPFAHIPNPATGLPMTDGISSLDVGGSPFGVDIHSATTSSTNDFDPFKP